MILVLYFHFNVFNIIPLSANLLLSNGHKFPAYRGSVITIGFDILQSTTHINTLRPMQNGRHFADDIFKRIFLNENIWIPIKISLKFVPKGSINNIPALVQIMAWRRPGDKPLSEPMMVNLPTHKCVTRPQWVKPMRMRNSRLLVSSVSDISYRLSCDAVRSITYHCTCYNERQYIYIYISYLRNFRALGGNCVLTYRMINEALWPYQWH